MSQKFDEGGAKGLLLVNLSVANDGCRIVLDSKELKDGDDTDNEDDNQVGSDEVEPMQESNDNGNETADVNAMEGHSDDIANNEMPREERMVDITCLTQKLRDVLGSKPLDSYDIAPQLEDLRNSYDILEEEGYVDAGKALKPKVSWMSWAYWILKSQILMPNTLVAHVS